MDLALNNLQRLICHKTKETKETIPLSVYLYILFWSSTSLSLSHSHSLSPHFSLSLLLYIYLSIYLSIYIYIYIPFGKTKPRHIRIINLFPSWLLIWINNTKFNRTSSVPMDIINTVRIEPGGKGWRRVNSFLPISPTSSFSFVTGWNHKKK